MRTFEQEVKDRIAANGNDAGLQADAAAFMKSSLRPQYSYNFTWLGRPIIQYPQDMMAMQEIIWAVQPDLIVETGIAHGGSLVFSAAMLELNAACGGPQSAAVLGVDIDIRPHNRAAIESHPMSKRITMLQGSSIAPEIIAEVRKAAEGKERILVALDSNHTHDHVLAELEAYAPLVTRGSYCVVFDTIVEDTAERATVAYSCRGLGSGRTTIVKDNRNHFTIDAQGIRGREPFAVRQEFKRVGDC